MKNFRTQRRKRTSTMEKSSLCYNKKKRKLNGFSSFEKKLGKNFRLKFVIIITNMYMINAHVTN